MMTVMPAPSVAFPIDRREFGLRFLQRAALGRRNPPGRMEHGRRRIATNRGLLDASGPLLLLPVIT